MRASGIRHTTTTGGTGDLTLVRDTGYLSYVDVFGGSGTRFVDYAIEESANNLREWGIGSIALSTGVLTRTCPIATQSGTTYDATTPSKLNFGTTGVTVSCRPVGETSPMRAAFFPAGGPADDLGVPIVGGLAASAASLTNDREYYVPGYWDGGCVTQVALWVVTGQTGGAIKWAIYEVGSDGFPGQRLHVTASNIACTSGNGKTESVSFYLPAGPYYFGIIPTTSTGALTLRGFDDSSIRFSGSTSGIPIAWYYASGSYSTGMPSPATASGSLTAVGNNNVCPVLFLKPSNT